MYQINRNLVCVFLLFFSLLLSCTAKLKNSELAQRPETFKAPEDKALLFFYARIPHVPGWDKTEYYVYLDDKLIGQCKQDSYFSVEVPQGNHYIFIRSKGYGLYGKMLAGRKPDKVINKGRMNFKTGKMYFLAYQKPIGFLIPKNPQETKKEMLEHKYEYYKLIKEPEYSILPKETMNLAIKEFNKEVKDDPEKYRNMLEYIGY